MPGRAARLWSPMPAALIWYLAKPRRESGAAFLEGTQRGKYEDHCAHSVTACCSAAIWCRDPACLCHKRARRQGPLQEGDAREKEKESKKREMERERASKEERRHRRAYRRQAAVTEVISSNRAACFASDGRQGPWLPGTKPGPGGQERVENSGNELLVLRAGAG